MRCLPSLALILSFAAPALADVPRPLPRPAQVAVDAAFQSASPLAPRTAPRPQRAPGAAPQAALPEPASSPSPLPVAIPAGGPRATDAPPAGLTLTETIATLALRAARLMPAPEALLALAGGGAPRTETILSTSNGPAPLAVTLPVARVAAFVSPRPRLRPETAPVVQAAFVTPRRPLARPDTTLAPLPAVVIRPQAFSSLRPAPRPQGLKRRAAPANSGARITLAAAAPRIDPGKALVKPKKGALCGDPTIRGERLAPIPARAQGCGIAEPVRVTEVAGVRLSPAATIDCAAARALSTWVTRGLKPAVGKPGVAELKIAASYACRTRNNVKGAKISEHGRGNAIDISAVVLGNGKRMDVLGGYKREPALRAAHKAACGIFGTTLGPGSDGYHENHLHFDVARYRSGSYCR